MKQQTLNALAIIAASIALVIGTAMVIGLVHAILG